MAFLLNLNMINVNTMQNNAAVLNGENQSFGWDTHQKQSTNTFTLGVLNANPANFNFLTDNDVFDTTVNDPDFKPGFMTQQV